MDDADVYVYADVDDDVDAAERDRSRSAAFLSRNGALARADIVRLTSLIALLRRSVDGGVAGTGTWVDGDAFDRAGATSGDSAVRPRVGGGGGGGGGANERCFFSAGERGGDGDGDGDALRRDSPSIKPAVPHDGDAAAGYRHGGGVSGVSGVG